MFIQSKTLLNNTLFCYLNDLEIIISTLIKIDKINESDLQKYKTKIQKQ